MAPLAIGARRLAATLLGTLAVLGAGPAAAADAVAAACPDCNVLLITVDTLRADHLPCYGYGRATAPHLCGTASAGVLYERAYSAAPATVGALRAMLSGQVISNVEPDQVDAHYAGAGYLASDLAARGFVTAAFTDHAALGGVRPNATGRKPKRTELAKGFASFANFGQGRQGATSRPLAEGVVAWLDGHAKERFFVWAHFFDPHFNYDPPDEHARAFGFDPAACGRIAKGIDIREIRALESSLTPAEVGCLTALYDAEILHTDVWIGHVLAALDRLGLAGRTLVVISADHGEEFMERGRVGHEKTLFDEVLHVPLIVRPPVATAGGFGAGTRVATPVGTREMGALIGAALAGQPFAPSREVVSRTYLAGANRPAAIELFAWRTATHKLVWRPGTGDLSLYDVVADPGERTKLADPERKEALRQELARWMSAARVEARAAPAEREEVRHEMEEKLKSLGYVGD